MADEGFTPELMNEFSTLANGLCSVVDKMSLSDRYMFIRQCLANPRAPSDRDFLHRFIAVLLIERMEREKMMEHYIDNAAGGRD